jgi:hypothetical protein
MPELKQENKPEVNLETYRELFPFQIVVELSDIMLEDTGKLPSGLKCCVPNKLD